jgi:hypothetical protein
VNLSATSWVTRRPSENVIGQKTTCVIAFMPQAFSVAAQPEMFAIAALVCASLTVCVAEI